VKGEEPLKRLLVSRTRFVVDAFHERIVFQASVNLELSLLRCERSNIGRNRPAVSRAMQFIKPPKRLLVSRMRFVVDAFHERIVFQASVDLLLNFQSMLLSRRSFLVSLANAHPELRVACFKSAPDCGQEFHCHGFRPDRSPAEEKSRARAGPADDAVVLHVTG